jgi:hypothetical protein
LTKVCRDSPGSSEAVESPRELIDVVADVFNSPRVVELSRKILPKIVTQAIILRCPHRCLEVHEHGALPIAGLGDTETWHSSNDEGTVDDPGREEGCRHMNHLGLGTG